MAGTIAYSSLLLTLLMISQIKGQKFNGKVESFAFDVKATPAGGAISLKPPTSNIQDSGSKVDYSKTDSMLVVPPITNQAMAMVESLHSKLDVKGPYAKWNPKIITKNIKVHRLISPRLIPLQSKRPVLAQFPRLRTLRRGTQVGTPHTHQKSLFQHRSGSILSPIEIVPIKKFASIHRITRSIRSVKEPKAEIYMPKARKVFVDRYTAEQGSLRGRRTSKREISGKDDLSTSIEALIVESLKKRKTKNEIGVLNSLDERNQTKPQKVNKISQRRKIINDKIKELGSPEVKKYMNSITSKVSHVVSEAKNVLQDTGRIVHGIKKVINGAKLLTDFTKNAVKFAKYFAMEPNNSTVDFFEEKAVMAVLEAQKAAAEAKIAAVEAGNAAKRVEDLMHKLEKRTGSHSSKKIGRIMKYVEHESRRAEQLAHTTSNREKDARQKAVIVDKALRKMIHLANEEIKDEENAKKAEKENEEESEEHKEGRKETKVELENEKTKLNEDDGEGKDKEEQYEKDEKLKMKEKENTENGISAAKKLKNISKDDEEGSGNAATKHNETADTERNDSSFHYAKNNSKTEGLEASELPDLFQGGGDGNEVVANDFEQEGFSIPEAENKHSEAEKEIANVLDRLADKKITQNERLQQLLKMDNEASQSVKSSVNEHKQDELQAQASKISKDTVDKNVTNSNEETSEKQSTEDGEDVGNDNDDTKEEINLPNATPTTRKALHIPTAKMGMFKEFKVKPTNPRTIQSNLIERKVEKLDKGPLKLVVMVTRRKIDDRNKTFGGPMKAEKQKPKEGKRPETEEEAMYDPFNFEALETQQHQNSNKAKYIVDKEDEGRAGLTASYDVSKAKTTKSYIPKIATLSHDLSTNYDYKPTDIVTQI